MKFQFWKFLYDYYDVINWKRNKRRDLETNNNKKKKQFEHRNDFVFYAFPSNLLFGLNDYFIFIVSKIECHIAKKEKKMKKCAPFEPCAHSKYLTASQKYKRLRCDSSIFPWDSPRIVWFLAKCYDWTMTSIGHWLNVVSHIKWAFHRIKFDMAMTTMMMMMMMIVSMIRRIIADRETEWEIGQKSDKFILNTNFPFLDCDWFQLKISLAV